MVEADRGGGGARRADRRREPGRLAHAAVRPAELRAHLRQRGIRNAMVAMLPGESA